MSATHHRKRDATREQIVKAAIQVFGGKSYLEASISEIAQRAEVAEGTIYQHFKNKEDLLFFIPNDRTDAFCEGLELHLQGIQDARNKLAKFAWYYLYFFKTNPAYARIAMLELRVNKNFQKTNGYRLFRGWFKMLRGIIEQGQREGSVRNDMDPVIIQELLLGTLEHYVTRWLLKDESWDLLEFREQTIKLIMNGIQSVSGEDTKMATAAKKSAAEGRRPKGEPLKNKQMT
ncbi:MAG: TetR/AcrR family transcriptional regulator [Syntrophorhabdus sp.]|jgi:TetR/AcrR family fatty acid metabolism transcriptional regulator|nr:TetR/AcrR family transcriptional regulator [Syntrophorhabdus sp.]